MSGESVTTDLLRRAHDLLLRVVNVETYHAPDTGLHTIAPRLYQAKAALTAVEQALRFPSNEPERAEHEPSTR